MAKNKLLVAILLAAGTAFAYQIGVGITIGAPPPPRVVHVRSAAPGPAYAWVDGYWYPVGRHYHWHAGYWTRPAYEGAHWVTPRYESGRYFGGYWEGPRGRVEHDHRWDHEHDRDWRHEGH